MGGDYEELAESLMRWKSHYRSIPACMVWPQVLTRA